MQLKHIDLKNNGKIYLLQGEASLNQGIKDRTEKEQLLTIAINGEEDQQVQINGVTYNLPAWSLLPLVSNESFRFEKPEQITAWQYNRDFYCLADHNYEVSCIGFIFFGFSGNLFINLDEANRTKLENLQRAFIEEFNSTDNIQTDMLQMLLKQLVIITTRIAKQQYMPDESLAQDKFDLIRQYNVLVYTHYRKEHQVQFYANLLNRSPKTLSNIFSQYNYKSPSLIIHEKIIGEAKRLFYYTDKSTKEIAHELGFEDAAHFSRFFKNLTDQNPSEFRKHYLAGNTAG